MAQEDEAFAARKQKLDALRTGDGVAFPNDLHRSGVIAQLRKELGELPAEELKGRQPVATLAGRLMRKGSAPEGMVATIQDLSGSMAVFIDPEYAGKRGSEAYQGWDEGDIVGIMGMVTRLSSGELALRAHELRLLSKSLRQLPAAAGASRERYADLIVNEESRRVFMLRSRFIAALRAYFAGTSYMEVETPLLEPVASPGEATPLATHHNALDRKLFLRASPGRNLQRLVVGGIDKLFEVNRSFREGAEAVALGPERTTMEVCCSFANHLYMATLIEHLLRFATGNAFGDLAVTLGGKQVDLGNPFARITLADALRKHGKAAWTDGQLRDAAFLASAAQEAGCEAKPGEPVHVLQRRLFAKLALPHLVAPTFVFDFAAGGLPAATARPDDPALAERFVFCLGGEQAGEAVSCLNDPEALAILMQDAGAEAQDPDYLRAIEYGLPPSAAATLELDVIVAKFTGSGSVRDVILFPQARADADRG